MLLVDGLVGAAEQRSDPGRLVPGQQPALVRVEAELGEEPVGEARVVVLPRRHPRDVMAPVAQCRHDRRELHDLGTGTERHQQTHQDSNHSVKDRNIRTRNIGSPACPLEERRLDGVADNPRYVKYGGKPLFPGRGEGECRSDRRGSETNRAPRRDSGHSPT